MTDQPKIDTKPEPSNKTVEKSAEVGSTQKSDLDRVVEIVGTLAKTMEESVKSSDARFAKIEESLKTITSKPKAMETPTDFPAKPKDGGQPDDNDIGDKIQAPNNFYQGQSQQAGIDDASPKSPLKTDQPDLKMEKKSVAPSHVTTTETPRPSSSDVNKASAGNGYELNPILKDARAVGIAGIDQVARDIRKGKYHSEPSRFNVGGY